jgi:enoyl-CoA hydratase
MYSTLHTELTDNILTVTINRPDKLNAINKTVMSELGEVVTEIYVNQDIKGALITGAGPKAFVAGADISEFLGLSREEGQAMAKKGQDIFMRIEHSPKPILAAVNGFALGGGCELAMACHFRVGTNASRFGQPEVNLGLIPGYGGTQRLTQLVGKGKALELMLTGRMMDASEALQCGLINYIIEEPAELLTKTREMLAVIISKAPIAIARIIECANIAGGSAPLSGDYEPDPFGGGGPMAAGGREVGNGFLREQEAFGECFATEDMKEGAAAFLEKRKPHFKGK